MVDTTDFQAPTNIQWGGMGGYVGTVEYGGGDKGLVVFFYNKSVHNKAKSLETGRQIYNDVVYVRMAPPGEKLNIVERPAHGGDARRFPQQWNQFTQNKQQTTEGTPVDLLYPDTPSVGATLRACGVYTVEQLADLSANAIENVGMGSQAWVNAAQKYMAAANKGVKLTQYRHDLEDRDREVAFLKKQVEDLMNTVQQLRNEQTIRGNIALQTLVAANMPRPTHMPNVGFDAETAMINARGRDERKAPKARGRAKLRG